MTKIPARFGYTVPKGDLRPMDECMFVEESNKIEGIYIDTIRTVIIGETPKPIPELDNHFSALKYVMDNHGQSLTERHMRNLHFILMKDLYTKEMLERSYPGNYRKGYLRVGRFGCPNERHLPELIQMFVEKSANADNMDSILESHYLFEYVHPFVEGNGRTGILLMNWLSLNKLGSLYVIEAKHKEEYFQAIGRYQDSFRNEHPEIRHYRNINKKSWDKHIKNRRDVDLAEWIKWMEKFPRHKGNK